VRLLCLLHSLSAHFVSFHVMSFVSFIVTYGHSCSSFLISFMSHVSHVNSWHSCQFMAFMSIHGIHVNLSHPCQFMAFMSIYGIYVNSYQFMIFMSIHVIHVNSCHSCQFMSLLSIHVIHVNSCHSCQFMSIHVHPWHLCQFIELMSCVIHLFYKFSKVGAEREGRVKYVFLGLRRQVRCQAEGKNGKCLRVYELAALAYVSLAHLAFV
jgi:hypothetical protein